MTDGTSQGLFIVVAIVIFGIFTLMAYILFEDTLSPALASMFTQATEQVENNMIHWETHHEDSELSLWDTFQYESREGTVANVDTVVTHENNPSLMVTFGVSSEGVREGTKDFVIWLDANKNHINLGGKVKITFYVRSVSDSVIGTRIGGTLHGDKFNTEVTNTWKKITIVDTITRVDNTYKPAVVFYSNTPDTFWISNITVSTEK